MMNRSNASNSGGGGVFIPASIVSNVTVLWIIVSNLAIIASRVVYKPLQKRCYLFLSNLAVSDLATALFVPGLTVFYHLPGKTGQLVEQWCMVLFLGVMSAMMCSVLNLLLVTLDRFIAVLYPIFYKTRFQVRHCWVLIIVTWVTALMFGAFSYISPMGYEVNGYTCGSGILNPYYAMFQCALIWLVLLLLAFFNIIVICTVRALAARLNATSSRSISENRSTEVRAVQLALCVVGVFFFCWIPYIICFQLFIAGIIDDEKLGYSCFLPVINSGLNFFIYAARSDKYRAGFCKLLSYCSLRRRNIMTELSESATPVPDHAEVAPM